LRAISWVAISWVAISWIPRSVGSLSLGSLSVGSPSLGCYQLSMNRNILTFDLNWVQANELIKCERKSKYPSWEQICKQSACLYFQSAFTTKTMEWNWIYHPPKNYVISGNCSIFHQSSSVSRKLNKVIVYLLSTKTKSLHDWIIRKVESSHICDTSYQTKLLRQVTNASVREN
jgi:hypothetical protein